MDEILVAIQEAANTIATPNWADIISVCFSLFAIIVAGIVGWRQNKIVLKQAEISEQQNKIALFEKRYAVYHELTKIVGIGEALDSRQMPARDELVDVIEASWGIFFTHEQDTHAKSVTIVKKLTEAEHIISQTIFLFPHVSEKDVDDLQLATAGFMGSVLLNEEIDFESISLKMFINTSKNFKEKYLDMIVRELDLTGGV